MRRLLAAAALTGLTLMVAACSTEPEPEGTAPIVAAPPPAPGASTGDAASPAPAEAGEAGDKALAGNSTAICTQAQKTSSDFAKTFAENIKLQADAASSDDPAARKNVEQKVTRDVQSYSYALGDLAKLAEDQQVKKGLTDLSKQVDAFKSDAGKLQQEQVAGFREGLNKACGQA